MLLLITLCYYIIIQVPPYPVHTAQSFAYICMQNFVQYARMYMQPLRMVIANAVFLGISKVPPMCIYVPYNVIHRILRFKVTIGAFVCDFGLNCDLNAEMVQGRQL